MGCFKKICFAFLILLLVNVCAFAGNEPVVSFTFKNMPLSDALDSLIFKHNIPIVYLKNQASKIWVTESCHKCTSVEAVKKLIKHSPLAYKMVNNQFVLYNSAQEAVYTSGELVQKEISLTGMVTDSLTKQPLPYATIVIEGTNKGAAANVQGAFRINNLPPDIYKLKILYLGYATDSIMADLRNSPKSHFCEVSLSAKSQDIDAVVVKSAAVRKVPAEYGATASTIDPRRIKSVPTPDPGDIIQNIKLLPGASFLPDNLGGFTLRGGTTDQTLVLLDGIPLYHSSHLWGFNSSLNADAVESIHVYTGSFPARYANRLSGVVDVKGKGATDTIIHASVFANLFTAKAFVGVPVTSKVRMFLSANTSTNVWGRNSKILNREDYLFFNQYIYAGSNKDNNGTSIVAQGNGTPFEQNRYSGYYDLYGKVTAQVSKRDSFSVSGIVNNDKISIDSKIEPDYVYLTKHTIVNSSRVEQWKTTGIALAHSHQWRPGHTTDVTLGYSNYTNTANFGFNPDKDAYFDSSVNINTNYIKQFTVATNSSLTLWPHSVLTFGVNYNRTQLAYKRVFSTFFGSDNRTPFTAFSNTATDYEYDGYLENSLAFANRMFITTGARFSYSHNTDAFFAEPRIHVKIELLHGLSAMASWGMFHQNLHCSPSAIAYNISSFSTTNVWLLSQKGLSPSQSRHLLLGIVFDRRKWAFHVSGYYKNYSNLVVFIPSGIVMDKIDSNNPDEYAKYISWGNNRKTLANVCDTSTYRKSDYGTSDYFTGTGYSKGLDVFIAKKTGFYTGFIAYNVSSTRYSFEYINMGNQFAADYDRTHELKIMNSLQWRGWNLSGLYMFASGKPVPGQFKVNNFYADGYFVMEHPLKWNLSQTQRTPAYQSVDLSLSKKIETLRRFKIWIGATVQNVFNHTNVLGRYNSLTTMTTGNRATTVNPQWFDQKSPGRLFNFFVSVEI